jgi:large subunit ribosomal protein L31
MAKKDIAVKDGELKLIISGEEIITRSSNPGKLVLEIDYRKHPAWTGSAKNVVNHANKSVNSFVKKFGGSYMSAFTNKEPQNSEKNKSDSEDAKNTEAKK